MVEEVLVEDDSAGRRPQRRAGRGRRRDRGHRGVPGDAEERRPLAADEAADAASADEAETGAEAEAEDEDAATRSRNSRPRCVPPRRVVRRALLRRVREPGEGPTSRAGRPSLNMEDYIFQMEVPTGRGHRDQERPAEAGPQKVFPGYVLVRMDLTDESWAAVRNTPGVTGFVGHASRPSPLTLDEVVNILGPTAEKKGARRPRGRGPGLPGRRVGYRYGRAVRDACRRRSTRSTPTPSRSRGWCRSSAERPRSSCRSPR